MSKQRKCRRCGCTYNNPCVDKAGMSCCWVERDLCSACLTPAERKRWMAGKKSTAKSQVKNSPVLLDVFARIADLRLMQRKQLCAGQVPFNLDSPVADDLRKYRNLALDDRQVAAALLTIEEVDPHGKKMLHDALVRLATDAVAWLELLEEIDHANHN